jgi:hypothetical protein
MPQKVQKNEFGDWTLWELKHLLTSDVQYPGVDVLT